MLLPWRTSPVLSRARSRIKLLNAAPRSSTTKQFDCWIIMRRTGVVGPSLYCCSRPYHGARTSSSTAIVPSGAAHLSRFGLAPSAVAPPADPVATVPPPPSVGPVAQPETTARIAARTATRPTTFPRRSSRAPIERILIVQSPPLLRVDPTGGSHRCYGPRTGSVGLRRRALLGRISP